MTVDAGVIPIEERSQQQQQQQPPGLPRSESDVLASNDPPAAGKPALDLRQHQQQRQQQQQQLASLGSRSVCRICHTDSEAKEPLISPCRCKGTQAHVHLTCLERWLNQSCRTYCELCNFRYNAVETQRYTWLQALRIWINHPRNRSNIRADLLIFGLLTLFTAGLMSVCLIGTRYFVLEGERVGFSEAWTRGAITLFMIIVILGYSASVYLLIKNQATPWYRWWRGAVNVRLILDQLEQSSELQLRSNDFEDEQR